MCFGFFSIVCFDVYDRANSGYILKDDLAEVLATGLERGSGSVEPNGA